MFIKNIQFTLLIRIAGRQHEFNFRKRTDDLYDGDTSDDRGNRYYFQVRREEESWRVDGKELAGWISDNTTVIVHDFSAKLNG